MSMPTEQQQMRDTAKRAVVRVSEGRGFVVQAGFERWIITAAHCLPRLPPPHGLSCIEERTYRRLLGPLDGKTDVWAECLFADPVADIAVLGPPDEQALFDECAAYKALTTDRLPVDGQVPGINIDIDWDKPGEHAEVLGLDGSWFGCQVRYHPEVLLIISAEQPLAPGMSGSPIVGSCGAIGVVCLGECDSPQPCLSGNLPGWIWRKLTAPQPMQKHIKELTAETLDESRR